MVYERGPIGRPEVSRLARRRHARTTRRPRPGGAVPRGRPAADPEVEIRELAVYDALGRAEVEVGR